MIENAIEVEADQIHLQSIEAFVVKGSGRNALKAYRALQLEVALIFLINEISSNQVTI